MCNLARKHTFVARPISEKSALAFHLGRGRFAPGCVVKWCHAVMLPCRCGARRTRARCLAHDFVHEPSRPAYTAQISQWSRDERRRVCTVRSTCRHSSGARQFRVGTDAQRVGKCASRRAPVTGGQTPAFGARHQSDARAPAQGAHHERAPADTARGKSNHRSGARGIPPKMRQHARDLRAPRLQQEPMVGVEPTTPALRKPCSAIELHRRGTARDRRCTAYDSGARESSGGRRKSWDAMGVFTQPCGSCPVSGARSRSTHPRKLVRKRCFTGWNGVCSIQLRTDNGAGTSAAASPLPSARTPRSSPPAPVRFFLRPPNPLAV